MKSSPKKDTLKEFLTKHCFYLDGKPMDLNLAGAIGRAIARGGKGKKKDLLDLSIHLGVSYERVSRFMSVWRVTMDILGLNHIYKYRQTSSGKHYYWKGERSQLSCGYTKTAIREAWKAYGEKRLIEELKDRLKHIDDEE